MKHSIKQQMMMVFVGIVVVMMLVFMAVNGGFLERYYIAQKQAEFIKTYTILKNGVEEGTLKEEKPGSELSKITEKNNIAVVVINPESSYIYTNTRNLESMMRNQLMGYLFGKNSQDILKETDDYSISKSIDPQNSTEYIEMWGDFDNGSVFLMRSPLESIRSAVKLFNQFIGMVGVVVILLSIVAAWFFSKKLTEPLMELAALSQKMANLDFDAKYTSGGSNEIGILGQSFNQMSEKLEQTISDLKKANNELQKDIERKEKIENMRTEFLGNVSHELKTPIALIQGYAEGLKEGVSDDPESREFYCDVIMDEAGKMNQMVKNLLTLNQLEFGDSDLQFERFNITDLIRGVLQSLDIMISQKEVRMIFRQEEPVYVWADEFKVEQVVRNYVNNALNHVDGEKVIEIKIAQSDEKARISVFNTGTPIPEADVEHIWEKFYKVDKARTREYGGNGIGLSIVKAIMESFQQEYGEKNYDNGVEFWFELDVK
ncbi:MAG: HAMP domain-containing sensor histidine kinase [Bariatricus sp.]|nr:HAMP domain-containing sensor histidine kinase [Bariatricus sp.]